VPTVWTFVDSCGRFLGYYNNQQIIDNLTVVKCVLRGRPQGGRALFSDVDFDGNDGSCSSIVNSFSFSESSKI